MALFQKLHHKKYVQELPISLDQAWEFFRSPRNLSKMTPEKMGFQITIPFNIDEMYEGQLITYIVKPILGIPMRWCTEITQVVDKVMFIDEQRFGPYAMWHHEHWFETIDGGIRMTDKLTYGVPLGFLGDIAHSLFVQREVENIFASRREILTELFGYIEIDTTKQ